MMNRKEELQEKLKWLDDSEAVRDDIDYIFDITGKYSNGIPPINTYKDGGVAHWTKSDKKNFKELDKLRKKIHQEELVYYLEFCAEFYLVPNIPRGSYGYDRNGFVLLKN